MNCRKLGKEMIVWDDLETSVIAK